MISYTFRQLQGKFKGIIFGVRKERLLNVGQTRVKHRYPKTSSQYMEEMGEEPFSCSVDLFFNGERFREDFERFEKAIKDPSSGRLYLPTFGVFNSIIAEPTSFESDQTALGSITASITFSETVERPSPTLSNISEQDVANLAELSRQSLLDVFANAFLSPDTINNLLTAKSDAEALAFSVKIATNKAREAEVFLRKVDSVITNPQQYAELLLATSDPTGFLQHLATTYTGANGFQVFKKLGLTGNDLSNSTNDINSQEIPKQTTFSKTTPSDFDLETGINVWDDDTFERRKRNSGRISIVDTFRVVALIGMMESSSTKNYTTTQEIDNDLDELEFYYEAIVENNEDSTIIPGMKESLDKLRNATDAVLEQKRQQSYTITEVEIIRPISCWLLAYELYGEYLQTEDQHNYMSELIAGLNRDKVRYRLEGTVKVVEVGS